MWVDVYEILTGYSSPVIMNLKILTTLYMFLLYILFARYLKSVGFNED